MATIQDLESDTQPDWVISLYVGLKHTSNCIGEIHSIKRVIEISIDLRMIHIDELTEFLLSVKDSEDDVKITMKNY